MRVKLYLILSITMLVSVLSAVGVIGNLKWRIGNTNVVNKYSVYLTLNSDKQVKYLGPVNMTALDDKTYQNKYKFSGLNITTGYSIMIRIYPKGSNSNQYFSQSFAYKAESWQTIINAGDIYIFYIGPTYKDFTVQRDTFVLPQEGEANAAAMAAVGSVITLPAWAVTDAAEQGDQVAYAKKIIDYLNEKSFWNPLFLAAFWAKINVGFPFVRFGGAYILLESPSIASDMVRGDFYSVTSDALTEFSKEVVSRAIYTPDKVSEQIAAESMQQGYAEYKYAYNIANKYLKTRVLSEDEAREFLRYRWGLDKIGIAYELYKTADNDRFDVDKQTADALSNEISNTLYRQSMRQADLDERMPLLKTANYIKDMADIFASRNIGLMAYQPYLSFKQKMEKLNMDRLREKQNLAKSPIKQIETVLSANSTNRSNITNHEIQNQEIGSKTKEHEILISTISSNCARVIQYWKTPASLGGAEQNISRLNKQDLGAYFAYKNTVDRPYVDTNDGLYGIYDISKYEVTLVAISHQKTSNDYPSILATVNMQTGAITYRYYYSSYDALKNYSQQ